MKVSRLGCVIVAVAAVLGFCSCNKKSLDTPQPDTQSVIGFSNIVTKAGLDTLQTNGFRVWAFINNATVTNELILNNAKVTYSSKEGSWEYSPLRYWIDESVFTFVAAYPYDENAYTLDQSNSSLNLTLAKTPSKKDYLIATNMTDTSVEGFSKTVNLQFKHILTSVGLNIWRDNAKHTNDQMRIKKVTLSNIRKTGTYSSYTDTWVPTNEKVTIERIYDEFSDSDNIGAANVNTNGTLTLGGIPADPFNDMMLIPQTLDGGSPVSLKIQYELKRQNAVDWETAELETVLPSITWEANRRYTYNVVLSSVTDITVYYIQTKVDPWGTPQVGGTVIIK